MKLNIVKLVSGGALGCILIAAVSFASSRPVWVATEPKVSRISAPSSTTIGPISILPDQLLQLLCGLVITDDKHQALERIGELTNASTAVKTGGKRWMFLEAPLFDVTYLSVAGDSDYAVEVYAEKAYIFENFDKAKIWMSQYGSIYTEWDGEVGQIAIGFGSVPEKSERDNEKYLFSPVALTYVHEEGYQAFNVTPLNRKELSDLYGYGIAAMCQE